MPQIQSKLPDVGTTIFTTMSALAAEHGAINLSQGFPDFDAPAALLDRVEHHLRDGQNQYAPMIGVPSLRAITARNIEDLYGLTLDPDQELTITSGATEALFCAIAAVVGPGDEVIVFDPAYDSYEPVVRLQGGRTVHVPLLPPGYGVDWDRVADLITDRTRLIITNTPHNPTGTIWSAADVQTLASVVADRDIYVLADEVYEHIVFDGARHESVCRYPELFARSFVVSSYGKSYHVTGWKIGYCAAPAALSAEFRKIHQYVTFTSNTPVQLGLADFMSAHPEHHQQLGRFYQAKRDRLLGALADSRFASVASAGTYFQLLDYTAIGAQPDHEWVRTLTREVGVAAIPVSVFYRQPPAAHMIRLCFAKDDATLDRAAEILCQL
ncbi:MAG: pyridoxal phosphate-dependent aminotransferase [Pseudomonadales bacterium]